MATAHVPQAVRPAPAAPSTHRNPVLALLRGIGIVLDTALRVVLLGRDGIRT
jgi:hypothetical protein